MSWWRWGLHVGPLSCNAGRRVLWLRAGRRVVFAKPASYFSFSERYGYQPIWRFGAVAFGYRNDRWPEERIGG